MIAFSRTAIKSKSEKGGAEGGKNWSDETPWGEQNLIAREHRTINKRASAFTSPLFLFCATPARTQIARNLRRFYSVDEK